MPLYAFAQSPSPDPVTSCKPAGKPPQGKDGLPCKDLKNPVFGVCAKGECVGQTYTDEKGKTQKIQENLKVFSELLKGILDKLNKPEEPKSTPAPTPNPVPIPGGCLPHLQTLGDANAVLRSPLPVPAGCPYICGLLWRNITRGATGADVKILQSFLADEGVFSAGATGYFGPLTEAALAKFQVASGIVKNEDDGGAFGPLTSQYLQPLCRVNPPPVPTPPPPGDTTDPTSDPNCKAWSAGCANPYCTRSAPGAQPSCTWSGSQCVVSTESAKSKCVEYFSPPPTPQPTPPPSPVPAPSTPVINGLDAPSALQVGEVGKWTVHASVSNQSNASLRYSVTWGDESGASAIEKIAALANEGATQVSGSFTHIYNHAGIFTPKFTVSNDAGSAQTSATVSVGLTTADTPPQPPPSPQPPERGAGDTSGGSCTTPWGTTVSDGQTATGFCSNNPLSQAACGFTKLCQNGLWVLPFVVPNTDGSCPAGWMRCGAGLQSLPYCSPASMCNNVSASGGTANLANALTALEAALKALLAKLGQ